MSDQRKRLGSMKGTQHLTLADSHKVKLAVPSSPPSLDRACMIHFSFRTYCGTVNSIVYIIAERGSWSRFGHKPRRD